MHERTTVDVSVVIPTYNRLWSLPDAVQSCRGARCATEIIVVDDGSTDGTWEWLGQQDDVVAIRQPNQGQTWAVNRGVAAARGPYIRFLDSDDVLADGVIDEQFDLARSTGAQLVYGRVDELRHPSGRVVVLPDLPLWDDFVATQLGEGEGGHYLGMLFARDLIMHAPRRPDFALRDDRMLLLEIGLQDPRIARSEGRAGYWRKHDTQMHDSYGGLTNVVATWQYIRIYRRVLGELAARGDLTERRKRAAAPILWSRAHAAARVDIGEGGEVARWALQLDPTLSRRPGLLNSAYRHLGFATTETLLAARRAVVSRGRRARTKRDWYGAAASGNAVEQLGAAPPVHDSVSLLASHAYGSRAAAKSPQHT